MTSFPQNAKSAAPGSLIGQRHLPCESSTSEQCLVLSTGASTSITSSATLGASAPIRRRSRRWVESLGRWTRGRRERAGTRAARASESPRRLILPITALRLTPIWAAICLQVRPATTQFRSWSTRSGVQVSRVIRRPPGCRGQFWAADRAKARAQACAPWSRFRREIGEQRCTSRCLNRAAFARSGLQ